MMGPTHRLTGAVAGAAVASWQGQPFEIIAMTAIIATATAHGWSSPDVDQTGPWVRIARAMPDVIGRLMAHRKITHWWGLPVVAWWFAMQMPEATRMPALALIIGWTSHLLGDLVFGKLPIDPWGKAKVGLPLRTGGAIEKYVAGPGLGIGLIYLLVAPWPA